METSYADFGGHGLIYGMHALSQESSIIDSHITVTPSNLTGTQYNKYIIFSPIYY